MNETLRVAIAGGGKMARQHAEVIDGGDADADVIAFAEPARRVRRELREQFPKLEVYDRLQSLLESESMDVVHICTPPSTHVDLALLSLKSDCAVYVEKPFAPSLAAAKRILALAAERDLQVMAGHQVLFQSASRRLRELRGSMGTITHVESHFSFSPSRGEREGGKPLAEHKQLLDVLPHPVYLLVDALTGQPIDSTGEPELLNAARGPGATVHAQIRMGTQLGHLVVSLEGRPVASYLRLVGTNGSVHADFIRDTVQQAIGSGSSTLSKVLSPYLTAKQLVVGSTRALIRRLVGQPHGYPGLAQAIDLFHRSIRDDSSAPLSPRHILSTVSLCEQIAEEILSKSSSTPSGGKLGSGTREELTANDEISSDRVIVTGGTGFLGRAIVARLRRSGVPVRAVARRVPPPWQRLDRVDYQSVNLAADPDPTIFEDARLVVHCAAETSGSWEAHRRNTINATENVIRLAYGTGAAGVLHVSSTSVLEQGPDGVVTEESPLRANPKTFGPYVWGKVMAERRALRLSEKLDYDVKIVRPASIVDMQDFDPPGRLGRRIGDLFIAVGDSNEKLESVSLDLAAAVMTRLATHFDEAPYRLNLLSPELLTRGSAAEMVRAKDPNVKIIWLPRSLLNVLSPAIVLAQKTVRPTVTAIDPKMAFATRDYDLSRLERILEGTNIETSNAATAMGAQPSSASVVGESLH